MVTIVVSKHACITLSVIRFGIDPVAPLEIYILEHGDIAFRHGQEATEGSPSVPIGPPSIVAAVTATELIAAFFQKPIVSSLFLVNGESPRLQYLDDSSDF